VLTRVKGGDQAAPAGPAFFCVDAVGGACRTAARSAGTAAAVTRLARTRAQGITACEHRHPQPLQEQVRRGRWITGPVVRGQFQQRPCDATEIADLAKHGQRAVEELPDPYLFLGQCSAAGTERAGLQPAPR
jgi:hypothetical protein